MTKKISKAEAIKRKMFGPVYHGTHEAARDAISREGFKVHIGSERSGDISHGYQASSYAEGKPAPTHHLGFGVYFTTMKSVAKSFNQGSLRGIKEYYLEVPRLETINFGAPGTMMKWWVSNGYDIPVIYPNTDRSNAEISQMRVEATVHLTDKLKAKWDAIWFKGKSIRKLLDGDQICVFDPTRIYEIDTALAGDFEIGSKVKRKSDGMLGVIKDVYMDEDKIKAFRKQLHENSPDKEWWVKPETKNVFSVKWQKGGTEYNVQDVDLEPFSSFKKKVTSKYIIEDVERRIVTKIVT